MSCIRVDFSRLGGNIKAVWRLIKSPIQVLAGVICSMGGVNYEFLCSSDKGGLVTKDNKNLMLKKNV